MPKLRGKYDHPAFGAYPRQYRMDRNFYYFLEDLARKNSRFKERWEQIRRELHRGHLKPEEANKQTWQEIVAAIKRHK